ncbi:NADPH quinone reductase MdaB [Neptunitalea chrysea]|uniref:NADPH quinone reductase MdaB n=1 Tax=Neptunitalea chrysea TaxID=1647581 RepID=A0A9W6EU97_9FLAO|nr:NAD(P)H-dependent oxidoreductase [Neptunitalea chrysea]GLB51067.1 NADPH quinone reductase MdaB [Neptunitalea chrysea]
MTKVFAINGGYKFAHSPGQFNHTLLELDKHYFTPENGFELRTTDINEPYNPEEEVANFLWADAIIYHFPIWWFAMPYALKEYIDLVFTAGHRKGMYYSDGRKMENPDINYGKGGLLIGKYMVTTSWNAPETAFTLPEEFFKETSVDDGILFGFHRMNEFISLQNIPSMHFYDIEKNGGTERINQLKDEYVNHLQTYFCSYIHKTQSR